MSVQRYRFLDTAVSVFLVSGFAFFFVHHDWIGFWRFRFGFWFPVRFAAFLQSPKTLTSLRAAAVYAAAAAGQKAVDPVPALPVA